MPSIRVDNIVAGTQNAFTGLANNKVPEGGAYLNAWASTPVALGLVSILAEDGNLNVSDSTGANLELAADKITIGDDQIVFNEFVGAGEIFVRTAAQVINCLVNWSDQPLAR